MGEKGLFGDLFDMNGDGKLDDFERALEFSVVMSDLEKEEEEQYEDFEDNDLEDEYDDLDDIEDYDDDEF